jgi:phage gpG-like protein
MAVVIEIRVAGLAPVIKKLESYTLATKDLREPFSEIADRFAAWETELFATQDHGAWPPLSKKYAAWKAIHYPGKPPMRRTDSLFNSLTSRPFGIEEIKAQSLRLGTAVTYAAYHQYGGWVPNWPPQRRIVNISQANLDEMVKILQTYLMKAMREANGVPAWAPGDE